MTNEPIKFEDGVAYERMMGVWTQLVGSKFLKVSEGSFNSNYRSVN